MPVRITNKQQISQPLADPINYVLKPYEVRTFPFVECDRLLNDKRFIYLVVNQLILIECILNEAANYESDWDKLPHLQLGNYVFWVDSLAKMRIKVGQPTSDFDGIEVGAGAVGPHGSTHVFDGSDPVPNIEILEGAWGCTVTEQVGDAVFENVANSVRQADSSSSVKMPVIGIIISKLTATTCIIARSGEVALAGLTVGQEYYASTTLGQLTTVVPTTTGQVAQYVGYAKNTTTLVVQPRAPVVRA